MTHAIKPSSPRWPLAKYALLMALAFGAIPPATAQPVLRRALPAGALSGLELDLEGPLQVRAGERARWLVVGYEIVRDRDYRPAAGATLQVFASYEPGRPVGELTLDARGRGVAEIEIPATLPGSFALHFDLRTERTRMSRRFSIQVAALHTRSLTLALPQLSSGAGVQAGERLGVIGRLADAFGAALADQEVSIGLYEGPRLVSPPTAARTRADGHFVAVVAIPAGSTSNLRVVARHRAAPREPSAEGDEVETTLPVALRAPAPSTLDLRARSRRAIVAPREVVEVDVLVRDARGVGIEGASVEAPPIERQEEPERATTDARGAATLRVRAPAQVGDGSVSLAVVVPGLARSNVGVSLRVSHGQPQLRAVVEGGALLRGVPSRVFARAVGPDGLAMADRAVTLRIGEQTANATTDAAGIAALELTLPFAPDALEPPDACGGGSALEAELTVASDNDASNPSRAARRVERLCLPLDPDGVARVRAAEGGGATWVEVVRRADARTLPIVVTLLERRGAALVPIDERVLAGSESRATFTAGGSTRTPASAASPATTATTASGDSPATTASGDAPATTAAAAGDSPATTAPAAGDSPATTASASRQRPIASLFTGTPPALPPSVTPDRPRYVRARALVRGAISVRGSVAAVDRGAAPRARFEGAALRGLAERGERGDVSSEGVGPSTPSGQRSSVRSQASSTEPTRREVLILALPPAAAAALTARPPRTALEAQARRAIATPTDDAVPAVWRGGREVFLPAVEEPVQQGILRDAWRQRAVYRTGRLALVLRAIEAEVAQASGEGDLSKVAVQEGGRWRFNRAVLERAVSGQPLGAEGARDLGGLPLSLASLEAADPSITFDRAARRVTRARLLALLVALRSFVHERGLDLSFARRGEVESWLHTMLEEGAVEESQLRDGWGHPFVLRASARPRFRLFTPVIGYELVAPGPDGRAGTPDDVWDPLARVLPSGGLYASAVDEDGLLVRLGGVALARATVAELSEIFEAGAHGGVAATPPRTWDDVLSPLRVADATSALRDEIALDDPLDPRPPGQGSDAVVVHGLADDGDPRDPRPPGPGGVVTRGESTAEDRRDPRPLGPDAVVTRGERTVGDVRDARPPSQGAVMAHDELTWQLRDAPGRYTLVAFDGPEVVARASLARGGDLRFVGTIPTRWPSAPLTQSLDFVALRDLSGLRLELEHEGAEATLAASGPRDAEAGDLIQWQVTWRATAPRGRVVVRVRDASGRAHATLAQELTRHDPNVVSRDRWGGALVRAGTPWALDVPRPEQAEGRAREGRARLIVTAPGRLHRDPLVRAWALRAPAIVAWAAVVSGDEPPREVRDALSVAATDPLSQACASVALVALDDRARGRRAQPLAAGDDIAPREAAALLMALSPTAPPPWDTSHGVIERLRATLRDTTRTHADEPLVLARAAAALLATDPRDESGRLLLARAVHALGPDGLLGATLEGPEGRGGRDAREGRDAARERRAESSAGGTAPSEGTQAPSSPDPRDALAGTVALAIAAHHAGDAALRDRALERAAPRAWLGLRTPGDLAFWWLAASASGALGAPEDATLVVDGAPVAFERGLAIVPLEGTWQASVQTRGTPGGRPAHALARFEARYQREVPTTTDAPFALSVEGSAGRSDRPAALELVVEARGASSAPQLLVRLPAASALDAAARTSLASSAGVHGVSDGPDGTLVIALSALASGEVRRLPLRLRWLGAGERVGPALAAWDAARPWASASTPGAPLTVEQPRD